MVGSGAPGFAVFIIVVRALTRVILPNPDPSKILAPRRAWANVGDRKARQRVRRRVLAVLAAVITIAQTLRGEVRPHPLSWFLFGVLSLTGPTDGREALESGRRLKA
jgi:hypothetical protein